MEEVMKQWKEEEEEAEVEEVGLVRHQAHMHVTTITTSSIDIQATKKTNESSGLNGEQEIYQTEVNSGDIKKDITLHPSDPIISADSTSLSNVRTESERVGIITDNLQLVKELHLESLYQKTPTQGFYCPNCKACIQKVLLLDTVREETSVPAQPPPPPLDRFRCSTCFSFLIPIGSWLFPGLVQDNEVSTIRGVQQRPDHSQEKLSVERTRATTKITVQAPETPQITVQAPDQFKTEADSGKQNLQPEQAKNDGTAKASNEEDHKTRDSSNLSSETPQDEHGRDGSGKKFHFGDLWLVLHPFLH
ncbi:uncharacterized protein LOC129289520 isoform X2 [Prosopis cineraria]|uniref:uncharacterized protein LOC129289520 isoform X2 n=1 Tax=Prosopis cineraria TaxID=364024 RepID=UPI00240F0730|nr:uncharacterized protein LOC129289520 isoform X2 [Prosopis cineraria]